MPNADITKVFISYASEDRERFALDLATRLREQGVDAWIDVWEMLPGDRLVDKIFEEGIGSAYAIIVILSNNSVDKPWVREELNAGFIRRLGGNCKLIPVVIDECQVPEVLRSTVWQKISDLSSYEEEFQRILDSVYGRTRRPPLGTPAAQLRRQRLRDELEADKEPTLSYPDAQRDLESLILDKLEQTQLRLKALGCLSTSGSRPKAVIDELLVDPDSRIRYAAVQVIRNNPESELFRAIEVTTVERLLNDSSQELATTSAKLACSLAKGGVIPIDIMTTVRDHGYWLIRKIAIACIIESGGSRTLDLLYEFRTTSYHVSQQLIRDYIEAQYGLWEDDRKRLAIDLLQNLTRAKRASRVSISKTEKLLEVLLRG